MGHLRDLLENRRGKFRAYYKSVDLGELASPPEVKAGFDLHTLQIHDPILSSRILEGHSGIHASVQLKLKAVCRALELLSDIPDESGALELRNTETGQPMKLLFPESRLLPSWEFVPTFAGDHLITLKFSAYSDSKGKLFYFSCT